MNEQKFTVLNRTNVEHGVVFTVFADNAEGFAAFIEKHIDAAQPGSTVDIADVKAVFRLRHDGTWELLNTYATDDADTSAAVESSTEALLDSILGEEEESA